MAKNESSEKRINDIINAAVIEFLEKGYQGASIDIIAKRAGISKGGFYHYFPNKEILLMEMNKKLSEPIIDMMEKAADSKNVLDGLSTYIKEYLHYWIDHSKEMGFFFLSMSKALESKILIAYYKEYIAVETEFFIGMFKKAIDLGET